MYECVMGMAKHEGNGTVKKYVITLTFADTILEGCILADAMGLGKTLQVGLSMNSIGAIAENWNRLSRSYGRY